jgi:alginate O-acetyltransferase complex protein AlgI
MAIASARCFGLEIPANFNMPYLSRSVPEFWRRWHISLSSWFRRYVYIPLGGNRRGLARACLNTMIVMLLSGLWHGAGWNFVVWGGLHGLAMVAQRLFRAAVPVREGSRPSLLGGAVSWLATMAYLCFAWVFFRAASFATAATLVGKMVFAGDTGGIAWLPTSLVVALPVVVLSHWIALTIGVPKRLRVLSFAGGFTLAVVILGVLVFAPDKSSPFIYFQF